MAEPRCENHFADLPTQCVEELVTILAQNQHFRIERFFRTRSTAFGG